MKMKATAIIHIAIIDLFLSTALRDNPGIKGAPVIIGGEGGELKKGAIIAASSPAMALGIRPGQSMRKALKAAPEVVALLPAYEAYEALSERFFSLLRSSAPLVESFGRYEAFISINQRGESPEGEDGVYLRATELAGRLQGRIFKDMGLHTRTGIAPNKPLARLAGVTAKKDGMVMVSKNEATAFIKGLSISSLPAMDEKAQRLLKELNMGNVEELSKTPLLFFEKNFGKFRGNIIYESSRARGPVEVKPFFEPESISDEITFGDGVEESSLIKETFYMLTEGLTLRLKAKKRLCRAISIKITFCNFECLIKTLELEEETDSVNSTWAAVLSLLEETAIPGQVLLLGLKLHVKG